MTEGQDKKRRAAEGGHAMRTENMTVGEVLRQVRNERRLALEDVSAAIHVRVGQLRAIEEGNIDALPGMTYAVGFVKSYASYLKLNPVEISNRFKAEHGAMKPVMPDLQAPQPIVESRMPDPMLVGVAAFCAILLLLGYTIFADGDEEGEAEVAQIEAPAPAQTIAAAPQDSLPDTAMPAAESADAADAAASATAPAADPAAAAANTDATAAGAAALPLTAAVTAPGVTGAEPAAQAETTVTPEDGASASTGALQPAVPQPKPDVAAMAAPAAPQAQAAPMDNTINIRKPGTRVQLRARQQSWVQVMDSKGTIVYKKLMKAGDRYSLPDESGLTLITSNAGGFDVVVDGRQVQPLGRSGEIVRNVPMDPSELKKQRMRRGLNQ